MELLDVCSIQQGCVDDGDGIRTTVFLRGCPFRCPWCCNPETLQMTETFYIDEEKCLKQKGFISPLCQKCERNGGNIPITECLFGVTEQTHSMRSLKDLCDRLLDDEGLFEESGGGITFSGGEPLLQSKELIPLLELLRKEKINIAFETTLYYKNVSLLSRIAEYVDQWIVDLKLQPQNTKVDYVSVIEKNLSVIRKHSNNIQYRFVYVEGVCINDIKDFLHKNTIRILEIIKCHALAKSKYKKLGIPFTDYTPTNESYTEFVRVMESSGINVKKLIV